MWREVRDQLCFDRGYEEGYELGFKQGLEEALFGNAQRDVRREDSYKQNIREEEHLLKLIVHLLNNKRYNDGIRMVYDDELCKALFEEYGLTRQD